MNNLPKRAEIKSRYRPEISESRPEWELNYQFLRNGLRPEKQYLIGNYFVDMAFPEYMLVVEYDGKIHLDNAVYDYKRHKEIEVLGWHILRIMNKGGYYEITLDLKNPEFISFPIECDVYRRTVQIVKDFIKKQKIRSDNFVVDYSSGKITETETFNGSGGFRSVGSLLKKFKRMGWN